jgi:hypothetical protein
MTGKEARVEAQLISGMEINKNTALMWIKDAVRDIVSRYPASAGKLTEEEFVSDGGPHVLGHMLARIRAVALRSDGYGVLTALRPETDYFVGNDNSITVRSKGNCVVSYYAFPDLGGAYNEDAQIPIPFAFQSALRYRLAAEIRGRAIGASDKETLAYEQAYNDEVLRAQVFATRQNKRRMPPGNHR